MILKRLNADGRGKYLGEFDGDDRILNVFSNGTYELTSFDLNNHFDDKMTDRKIRPGKSVIRWCITKANRKTTW
jgi:hypothetical protein